MQDWNVVISVRGEGYHEARRLLKEFGKVSHAHFLNVLVMKVDSIEQFMDRLQERLVEEPLLAESLGHVMPVAITFTFQFPEEFEDKLCEAVTPWIPSLAKKSFHVRMHRRGFKGTLSSQHEEQFLDHFLMERLAEAGTPGEITFDDPDMIVAVETVSDQAGLSLWSRDELRRYPFLHLD